MNGTASIIAFTSRVTTRRVEQAATTSGPGPSTSPTPTTSRPPSTMPSPRSAVLTSSRRTPATGSSARPRSYRLIRSGASSTPTSSARSSSPGRPSHTCASRAADAQQVAGRVTLRGSRLLVHLVPDGGGPRHAPTPALSPCSARPRPPRRGTRVSGPAHPSAPPAGRRATVAFRNLAICSDGERSFHHSESKAYRRQRWVVALAGAVSL